MVAPAGRALALSNAIWRSASAGPMVALPEREPVWRPGGNPVMAPPAPMSPRTTVTGSGAALPTAAGVSTANVETRPSGTLAIGGAAWAGAEDPATHNAAIM